MRSLKIFLVSHTGMSTFFSFEAYLGRSRGAEQNIIIAKTITNTVVNLVGLTIGLNIS